MKKIISFAVVFCLLLSFIPTYAASPETPIINIPTVVYLNDVDRNFSTIDDMTISAQKGEDTICVIVSGEEGSVYVLKEDVSDLMLFVNNVDVKVKGGKYDPSMLAITGDGSVKESGKYEITSNCPFPVFSGSLMPGSADDFAQYCYDNNIDDISYNYHFFSDAEIGQRFVNYKNITADANITINGIVNCENFVANGNVHINAPEEAEADPNGLNIYGSLTVADGKTFDAADGQVLLLGENATVSGINLYDFVDGEKVPAVIPEEHSGMVFSYVLPADAPGYFVFNGEEPQRYYFYMISFDSHDFSVTVDDGENDPFEANDHYMVEYPETEEVSVSIKINKLNDVDYKGIIIKEDVDFIDTAHYVRKSELENDTYTITSKDIYEVQVVSDNFIKPFDGEYVFHYDDSHGACVSVNGVEALNNEDYDIASSDFTISFVMPDYTEGLVNPYKVIKSDVFDTEIDVTSACEDGTLTLEIDESEAATFTVFWTAEEYNFYQNPENCSGNEMTVLGNGTANIVENSNIAEIKTFLDRTRVYIEDTSDEVDVIINLEGKVQEIIVDGEVADSSLYEEGSFTWTVYPNAWSNIQIIFEEPAPSGPRGDVNGDGVVDSDDAIYLLNYAMADAETRDEDYPLAHGGDVNGDGAIDSDDAIYLLNYAMADEETRDEDYPLAPETQDDGGLSGGNGGNTGKLPGGGEEDFH